LAKHILTDTRKRTTPALFEALLTLKVNREWWDEYSVAAAMKRLIKHEVDTEDDDNEE
jgi:sulfur relay (sulfurtransferase) DsrC/TusE family protein